MGYASHVMHFGTSGARNIGALFFMLRWDRYRFHKNTHGTRYTELVFFASGVICGSRSAFRCVYVTKCRHTTFYAQVGLVRIPQKVRRDTLHRSCVFAFWGWGVVGHVVHSGVPGPRNVDTLSCSGGIGMDSTKSVWGHVKPNLCFCIRWDLYVT
jgi:hypothetical protein